MHTLADTVFRVLGQLVPSQVVPSKLVPSKLVPSKLVPTSQKVYFSDNLAHKLALQTAHPH